MKLMSGTFDKPNKIKSIAIKFENEGWVKYIDQIADGVEVDSTKELLIIVRKYQKRLGGRTMILSVDKTK